MEERGGKSQLLERHEVRINQSRRKARKTIATGKDPLSGNATGGGKNV